ncbi:DUF421 domain-containing protein [Cytobacillus depressus]|uniref:DUF421 domain-containing protein n=1 Tax=Cytobacillus depressus TaxID=1602942 RepID=A0A6L3V639_9BACI|nr:DUF421 domain-containing protein [Cytobacillus depressus]
MDIILQTILRTCASFIILLFVSLWVGKHINSHINHYNFALSITIGSFIANMGFDTNLKFIPMMSAFLTLVLIYFLISFISSRNRHLRKWLSGQPTVIIENGKILDSNMKKAKYSLDDLTQQLREKDIFDVSEIEFAILEISGKLSIMKKTKYQMITRRDLTPSMLNQTMNLPRELIMDGKVIGKNFNNHYSIEWLNQEIKRRNLQLKNIQYAVISSSGTLFIDLFEDQIIEPTDME